MKTLTTFTCLALLITACPVFGDEKAEKPAEDKSAAVKTSPVKVRDITLQIPETWEASPNTNSLRLATFAVPPAEGKALKGKAAGNDYNLAAISGTYKKAIGPPVLQKTKPAENYRMMGVILIVKNRGVYFLKLAGPDKTIKTQADAFRQSFGGDAKTEKEFEF